jgi:hypothetical protein
MHNKNIWLFNQFAGTPESGWGERHFYFVQNWIKQGYSTTIFSGSYNHVFTKLANAPNTFNDEVYDNVPFSWVKTPKYNPQSFSRFLSFLIFSFKLYFVPKSKYGKPDIIIVSSMPIFPILTGYLLKHRYKSSKLIFEIRDIWPLTLMELGKYSKNHPAVKFIGWFEKFGYNKSDAIVSLLPNATDHFCEIVGRDISKKCFYIPNGLDNTVLKPSPLPETVLNSIPKDKFLVGYTGTIGLANALEYLVDAAGLMQDNKEIHFVIIGDGYLKDSLLEKSKDFTNISFFPKIRKNEVAAAIKLFDICFVGRNNSPLFKHGVSANKYFDYMLAAKPILDSNNFIKDPVELSGCGIIVKPDSAEAIKYGLLLLFNMSESERNEIGLKGYDYVTLNHNIQNLSNKYIELFK